MKRGFLFGLGSFLVVGVLAGLGEAFKGDHLDIIVGAALMIICAPLSVLVIRKANAAAPNKSRAHAIGGWLIGFLIVDAAILVPVALIAFVGRP